MLNLFAYTVVPILLLIDALLAKDFSLDNCVFPTSCGFFCYLQSCSLIQGTQGELMEVKKDAVALFVKKYS